MKRLLTVLLSITSLVAFGQDEYADTTFSNGVNDVFYSFRGGVLATEPADNWDIAFEISGFTGSIIINEGAGVALYKSPFTIGDWPSFDTTGMNSWPQQYNSLESWAEGAFNRGLTDEFDLGWGKYDVNSHQVKGDSVFLIKLRNGDWKKIVILNLASGTYNFRYADVDGSNEVTKSLNKSNFSGKTFGYFSITDGASLDREPDGAAWDLLFTRYLVPINMGTVVYYPVYGVKINKGMEVARREGTDVNNNDTINLLWDSKITNIGSDWKSYNNQTMAYDIVSDLSFFVKTSLDEVWKLYFTEYEGGSQGMSVFNVTNIRATSGMQDRIEADITVYPNPATSMITVNADRYLNSINLQLLDLQGREVLGTYQDKADAMQIDVASVPQGMYILQMTTGEGTFTQRVIIQ